MKQFLRLRGSYCLKRIQPINHICQQYASDKRNTYAGNPRTRPAFLRTFFPLSPDIRYGLAKAWLTRRYKIVRYRTDRGYPGDSGWQNKVRRKSGKGMSAVGKAQPIPCLSPSSLTLPSGPIPICPAYTSVKRPKSDTLANVWRLYSGRNAHSAGQRMGHGPQRRRIGVRLGLASELGANSMYTRIALLLAAPHGGQSETTWSAHGVQKELRSQPGGRPMMAGVTYHPPPCSKGGVSKAPDVSPSRVPIAGGGIRVGGIRDGVCRVCGDGGVE